MDAETYITKHWIPKRVWTHLAWPRHQERLRRCAELMPAAGRVLDVGCACGHSTEIMRRFRPEVSWSGADFSKTAIARAKGRFPGLSFYYMLSARHLEMFEPFDGVICSEVLEHTTDDAALAGVLLRITAGTLVVTTPWAKVSDPGHLRVYTEKSLRALFERPTAPGTVSLETWGQFLYMVCKRGR
ncbi:MAG TPA: methyltransferase domain-containing protein [Candidatus Deferrimicrobiaceae bacterium]|nr:methyltransferase domain-containing protein [Candidatus Deferrimicrobiaceae bacterium]